MKKIGRYKIVGELGRGAIGVVYQASDPTIGRSVAIKTIPIREVHDAAQRQKLRDRLFREARSAGVLSHPNIVTIYDIDEVDGTAWIAMAHVKGPNLERILAHPTAMPGANLLAILRQTASALDYAHTRGIVHRDIKPANIMLDEDGSVKITDFGIARIGEGQSTETKTVAGTPHYMSPEQIQGKALDGKADQFSLGVIAYEMLTGHRPWEGDRIGTIVYKIMHESPVPPSELNPTLTPTMDAVLARACALNPAERFPSCVAFVEALDAACAAAPDWRPRIQAPPKPKAPVRRRISVFWPVFLIVIVLLGVAGGVAWQGGLVDRHITPEKIIQWTKDAVVDAFRNGDHR